MQALFYAMPGAPAVNSFAAHAADVGIFAPQSFSLDRFGVLRGSVPPDLDAIARGNGVPIMPLVINAGFSRYGAERLLRSAAARDRAIGALLSAARTQNFIGWQLDFENLPSSQRYAFSRFVAELARTLHDHGKQLSVAVAARTSEDPGSYTWRTFSGVYDYAALARNADFLSVMAYPESDGTHPGPLASTPWVEQVINHVLLFVPPEKFSLGVPTYQTDWMERRVRVRLRERIGRRIRHIYRVIYRIFHRSGPVSPYDDLTWDPTLEAAYRITGSGHHRQVTWVADARSFQAKLRLIVAYHLRGFSVWRLGLEDPRMWNALPAIERAPAVTDPAAPPRLIPHSSAGFEQNRRAFETERAPQLVLHKPAVRKVEAARAVQKQHELRRRQRHLRQVKNTRPLARGHRRARKINRG